MNHPLDFIPFEYRKRIFLTLLFLTLILFAIFLQRAIRAATHTRDLFARYLAGGIAAMVVVQALFNISVVLGMMPTKGIPLPFISYGGSSLFVMLASVGVLLNITQQTD